VNRAQLVQTIAACEALAAEMRRVLKAQAVLEYEREGTKAQWQLPGYTVSSSISQPSIQVVNEHEWVKYVKAEHPHQVETITRPYPAWQGVFFEELVGRGDPPCDRDGRVVPGLAYVPGGEFRSVSVLPGKATKDSLKAIAQDIVAGRRPLGLPETVEVYG
jgi:hypothetical protein